MLNQDNYTKIAEEKDNFVSGPEMQGSLFGAACRSRLTVSALPLGVGPLTGSLKTMVMTSSNSETYYLADPLDMLEHIFWGYFQQVRNT